jgi:hypothetical protein
MSCCLEEEEFEGDNRIGQVPPSVGSHTIQHIVKKPDRQWCSCGVWQEFYYPCRHGCAVYRKWKEKDCTYVLLNVVNPFYTYEYLHKLFTENGFPTCVDNVTYDGETKPPASVDWVADSLSVCKPRDFADKVH